MDIFKKCYDYDFIKGLRANDMYPYFQNIQDKFGTEIVVNSNKLLMVGSNDYLGLSNDPRLIEAAVEAATRYGTSSSGSRLLNGTLSIHEELESRLAKFLKRDRALVFSTGFQTNLGAIAPLLGRNDYAIIDRTVHASIVDGIRLGYGKMKRFRHNDMEDLERQLKSCPENAGKLIIVDGVFSMEGDLAKLKEIVQLKKKYGARLLVDDAHGIGVLGENGRGTCEHFGVESDIDLITGTFSKSFGSLGGFVVGDADIIDFIQHNGRSMIFSASMTPSSVAATIKAVDIMETEPERRERLMQITNKVCSELTRLGFDIGETETPIIPIIIRDTEKAFSYWRGLMQNGLFTNPVISPAVPEGTELLRTSFMATHTDDQVDEILNIFEKVGREFNIINNKVGTLSTN
ncbi:MULTISPECIES: aminotransferase class I/II-fold pyridoxal phosphate-dependent enzyme [Bacillus]|uniref:aminotransferase class I/II-fold pyridoxal phosphate-dependent enzyme n=1 Tax=Bacillus TaxID=1386 RepID=UPI0002E35245|nr:MULTISPECIES: pyridoxal phosphate-dependent aminotransferase family protein [Bacillus]AYF07142.1 pyridoxal phosphate-dependent aminotransferase family protein [Bacillus mobilis]MBS9802531.1 pyridoxal phosphate-dependent aminotransferase family protein [Bacillus toyonensis]PEU86186.1 8-amino-7-oxononanoate synthase [Bacillus cereus]PGT79354.1 8-amino-7-oxononanoate synthase [Bacillus cereus]PGV98561.1 8-amino-7-oxononanoate synthase [Bacillus cereus]